MSTVEDGYRLYNERKFKEAYEALYDAAAYENNHEAQYYLGMMLADGDGVQKDVDAAMRWWKKALRGGHVDAASRMSEFKSSTKYMF